jgi:hypothetical protein
MSDASEGIQFEQDASGEWVARASKCGHLGNPEEMKDGLCVNCCPTAPKPKEICPPYTAREWPFNGPWTGGFLKK